MSEGCLLFIIQLTLSTGTVGVVEACATSDRSLLSYPEEPKVALKPNVRACRSVYARLSVRSPSTTSYSKTSVCGRRGEISFNHIVQRDRCGIDAGVR